MANQQHIMVFVKATDNGQVIIADIEKGYYMIEYNDRLFLEKQQQIIIEIDFYDNWHTITNPLNGRVATITSVEKINF